MSVSVTYRSRAPIDAVERARVIGAAATVADAHDAWVERLRFWPAEASGDGRADLMEGVTQVRLIVWLAPDEQHREVAPDDDARMSARELRHVVRALCVTGIDWDVTYGEPVGAIVDGAPTVELDTWLARLPEISHDDAIEILKKYPR